jgi:hypothetical protein
MREVSDEPRMDDGGEYRRSVDHGGIGIRDGAALTPKEMQRISGVLEETR